MQTLRDVNCLHWSGETSCSQKYMPWSSWKKSLRSWASQPHLFTNQFLWIPGTLTGLQYQIGKAFQIGNKHATCSTYCIQFHGKFSYDTIWLYFSLAPKLDQPPKLVPETIRNPLPAEAIGADTAAATWRWLSKRRMNMSPKRGENEMSHEKNPLTFHYTGWLIGILIMVYYNPYIIG